MSGYQGHKFYYVNTPKDPREAGRLRKLTEGRKRPLMIRWVKAEDGKLLYPAYQAEIPVGLKISIVAPLDCRKRDRWPEYDMVMVTMPDMQLKLEVGYRKVSILEFDALEKKSGSSDGERSLLYYPPVSV